MQGKLFAKHWFKTGLILSGLFVAAWASPEDAVDAWGLFSPRKIIFMIFALAFIQALGFIMRRTLGARGGAILGGFIGGLISSTATTAALAKGSAEGSAPAPATGNLMFLSATLAMLLEALAITIFGTAQVHASLFVIFAGPVTVTLLILFFQARHAANHAAHTEDAGLEILPILKLSAFVIGILTLSKVLQKFFGQSGLLVLTFLVSLFEIHGSVIANVQLHDTGAVTVPQLGNLLAISIAASYLSKLFLVFTLGATALKRTVARSTAALFLSLAASWLLFEYVT